MSKHIGYALTLTVLIFFPFASLFAQTMLWSANFGGLYNEMGNACQITNDSSIVILGSTYSFGAGQSDIYIVKTDLSGNYLWSNYYGTDSTEFGYDIRQTSDSGYIIVGCTKAASKDVYLIKVDSLGVILWEKTYGGSGDESGHSVRETYDNGFIIGGTTNSSGAGYNDTYLIKTDSLGNMEWERTYGGAGGETGSAARQTPDNGFVLIGSTGSFGSGYSSIYVVRTDANGDSLWATTYGGNRADLGYSIEITADGGLILVGATASYGNGESDAYLVKLDPFGNEEWDATFGGSSEDRGYAVQELPSGNFVITGKTESYSSNIEAYVVMTNPVGTEVWSSNYGGSKTDEAHAVTVDENGDLFIVGKSFSYTSGGSDLYLLKIQGDQATDINEPISFNLPDGFELNQNYPNPFNMTTSIEYAIPFRADVSIVIYNVLGQVVSHWEEQSLPAGTYRYEWDGRSESGTDVASGIYLYRLQAGQYSVSKKMLLLK